MPPSARASAWSWGSPFSWSIIERLTKCLLFAGPGLLVNTESFTPGRPSGLILQGAPRLMNEAPGPDKLEMAHSRISKCLTLKQIWTGPHSHESDCLVEKTTNEPLRVYIIIVSMSRTDTALTHTSLGWRVVDLRSIWLSAGDKAGNETRVLPQWSGQRPRSYK